MSKKIKEANNGILSKKQVDILIKESSNGRGRKISSTTRKFLQLKTGEGFTTNRSKAQSLRCFAGQNGYKISIRNLGNNSYLVIKVA